LVKVKLCGNQTIDDVSATADADAQGFIVWTDSARELTPEEADELMSYVPPFGTAVLVTTTTDPLLLGDLVEDLAPHALQIHAEMGAVQVERIRRALPGGLPLFVLLAVGDDEDPEDCLERAERLADGPLDGILLDSRVGGRTGGTGQPHDWEISARIRQQLDPLPILLAGGITPGNVSEAIRAVRPYAVDVASGVETNGRKDPAKVAALLGKVRAL